MPLTPVYHAMHARVPPADVYHRSTAYCGFGGIRRYRSSGHVEHHPSATWTIPAQHMKAGASTEYR